jgi:lysophospholipase L1-like esterase
MAGKSKIKNGFGSKMNFFRLITVLLPLFILVVLELLLRLFSFGTDVHLIVNQSRGNRGDYYMVNPRAGEKYFSRFEATSGTNDLFLKHKPENGFRIFVMGSSTVYGYPYGKNLMASRILQKRLQDAYPDRNIEVINTAFTAINSITLKDFIKQILDYEPDAILIYAGHNEFYGAFGIGSNETMSKSPFLRAVHFKLMNFRIYQFMRSGINGISKELAVDQDGADAKGTLMKRIVKDKDIVYKGEKYYIGIYQFKKNLSFILKQARKEHIPVFLSDLVSNIRDLPPFGNIPGTAELSATSKYKDAQNALSDGDTVRARELFYEAKDLDPVRFRASEDINHAIYDLSKQNGVILIPTKEWFTLASPGGLIGNNLITEHLHPNIEGQFVMADAFYTTLIGSKIIEAAPNPLTEKTKEYYRHNWAYTTLDSLAGIYKIKQLKSYWPFASLDTKVTFRDTFKTSGMVDSLSFSILINPASDISSLHGFLGDYYESHRQVFLAYKEFEALAAIEPGRSDHLNKAANSLLRLNDLYAAERNLIQSLKYRPTYFAYSMLGEINSIKHNYKGAINAYRAAVELADDEKVASDDRIILFTNLYKTYLLNNETGNARQTLKELSKLGFKNNISLPSREFDYSKYIPWNIEQPFKKALSVYGKNVDSSLYYLTVCLKTNDCPLVNFYIGNILYDRRDNKVLAYYQKSYDAYRRDPGFLVRFCVANLVNNDKSKARSIFNELILLAPGDKEIPQLRNYFNN